MIKKYATLSCFYGSYATVSIRKNGKTKWGLIDKSGNEIIPPIYDSAIYNGDEVVYVNIGCSNSVSKKKILSKNKIKIFWEENLQFGKWGIVNLKNELIVPFIYSRLKPFGKGLVSATLEQNTGLINNYGEIIVPLIYDLILPIRRKEGLFFALMKSDGSGVIDCKGNFVLEPVYCGIRIDCTNDEDEWIVVNNGNESFYLDKQWKRCCL